MRALSGGFICGRRGAPDDALRVLSGLAMCCLGAAEGGAQDCTCWEIEFDLDQAPVDETSEPTTRSVMCDDCAYRASSPERSGDPNYQHSDEELPGGAEPFWCHQGMRKAVRYRHRLGLVVEASGDYYKPPIRLRDGEPVPARADGTAAQRCAGWAARRRLDSEVVGEMVTEAASA